MGKKLFVLGIILVLLFTGCSDRRHEDSIRIETMELSGLPVVDIECTKDEDFQLQVPEQEVVTESAGQIVDYIVVDDYSYYIVAYDYYYHDFYEQIAVYKQEFGTAEVKLVAEKQYEQGIVIFDIRYDYDIAWSQMDMQGNTQECRIDDGTIIESAVEMTNETHDNDSEWQKGIDDSYLSENVSLVGENDNYIVWEQWKKENSFYDSCINIYDKKSDTIEQISKDEYGIVHTPVMAGNTLAFLTIDDIKSYKSDKDFYGNVYVVDLDTMKIDKITENYGSTDSVDTIIYDELKSYGNYIYFTSQIKKGNDFTYQYLYYIDTRNN